jgi:uncharacterized protein
MKNIVEKIRKIVEEKMKYSDSAHDFLHVIRVYNICLKIAKKYKNVDLEVLKLSALLHDIAREKEDKDKTGSICHAVESAKEAEKILKKFNYPYEKIEKIKHCILSHRYRTKIKPKCIEAKILHDADKLDCIGAIGIARCFMIAGKYNQKLTLNYKNFEQNIKNLRIKDLSKHNPLIEFEIKLKNIPKRLYTKEAKKMAIKRMKIMKKFFKELKKELAESTNFLI